uniref:Reverse transcriptase domain-containing protein n=1 Tax=Tanacetum cinerariifolium TaxID=118510 RepID=A0A6L2MGU5_TANCI|nr:reverse transcriptase domain-containing protein [Tanacetum cinerariifolium]
MIKSLDNQGQEKVTPYKLFNEESGKARSENSQISPLAEEVRGYSSNRSSRSRSRGRLQSAQKHQKSVSRKKGISKSHRSVRSEAQSRSKSKSVKLKPHGSENLSMSYRWPKLMPFTSRITYFRYHLRAKLPPNVQVYKGNKDPKDHLSIFSYRSRERGVAYTSMVQDVLPDPEWFDKDLLAKILNDKIPKILMRCGRESGPLLEERQLQTQSKSSNLLGKKRVLVRVVGQKTRMGLKIEVIEGGGRNIGTCALYARREGFTPLTKTPKEILAMDNVNFPPSPMMVGTPEKQNINKKIGSFGERHQARRPEEQGLDQRKREDYQHVVVDALIEGFRVKRIHVDSDSSSNDMYKHCFRNLSYQTRSRLKESRIELVGFSGEVSYPLRVIDLQVTIGECGKTRTVIMKFAMVKSRSPYTALQATTRETSSSPKLECTCNRSYSVVDKLKVANPRVLLALVETRSWRPRKEPMQLDDMEERRQLDKVKKPPKSSVEEKIVEEGGVNLEAYVDDMVIKCRTEQDIIKDIEQTFSTLKRINIKLNPKKCSFGMEEGKFLGYIVTSEGIKVNPKKAKAVIDMPSPRTLKQMQSLSGKLAALNRFLSKSAKRSLSFLDTLKKCTNKKDFRWIEAAEAAFLEMNKLVFELPALTTPKKGDTLMMYLAAMYDAVSAVLLTKRDGRQIPIHYVSQSLQGAETNYALMEKVALSLVHIARWLRMYFQAYSIKVITDNPIGQVLNNSGASGRAWRLYTNRASNNEGSGAGLILIAPNDVEYSYTLHLNFSNSNNKAKYEALLARLQIATKMQVKDIHAFVDSKLVASQLKGSYEAKGERMIKYHEKVLELAGAFNRF